MKKLIKLIDEFYDNNHQYYQTLMTILYNIDSDDYGSFLEMILEAKEQEKELYIDESDFEDLWDSFSLSNVKVK